VIQPFFGGGADHPDCEEAWSHVLDISGVSGADLTIPEAEEFLDPPLTRQQLRLLIRLAGLEPAAYRRTGRAGRPYPAYPALALMRLHAAVAPLITGADLCDSAASDPGR
jgi:hypothetical protein